MSQWIYYPPAPIGCTDAQALVMPSQWEDLRFPASGINLPGSAKDPAVDNETGLFEFRNGQVNTIAGVAQMPHGWEAGTLIHPHLHIMQQDTGVGDVVWEFEHKIANVGDDFPTDYTTDAVAEAMPGAANRHVLHSFSYIDMTGYRDSCVILWRVSRVGNDAGDTYGESVFMLEFDIHYQASDLGSTNEFGTV